MANASYKKFMKQAKSGIKGEAFFEMLMTDYAIPHHVVGAKDLGIDYFCEWVYGNNPTGILFGVQVKSYEDRSVKVTFIGVNEDYNGLDQYTICDKGNLKLLEIKPNTLQYWKGLGIPIYLFVIVQKNDGREIDCFYRRYTPRITSVTGQDDSGEYFEGFYKVNDGASLIAFKDPVKRIQGFTRDLFIDHVRYAYANGMVSFKEPEILGLNQFQQTDVFTGLVENYEEQIRFAYEKTGQYLESIKQQKSKNLGSSLPPMSD